jgi:hypothetical protein
LVRIILSSLAAVITLLATMTAFCGDEGGVSSWERCSSWFGNPILEWPGGNWSPVFPLLLGIAIGVLVWWLLGFTPLRATRHRSPDPAP